jgi:hypothetical protein
MLDKKEIKQKIREKDLLIRKYGISKVGLFGSYVRGQQRENSDIDILIDFEEGQETFDNFIEVCAIFDSIFKGKKVEVVTINGLSPYIGPHILKEVEYVKISN